MAVEVALAMLQREGRWLMQLRDDVPGIVAPGWPAGEHRPVADGILAALQRVL